MNDRDKIQNINPSLTCSLWAATVIPGIVAFIIAYYGLEYYSNRNWEVPRLVCIIPFAIMSLSQWLILRKYYGVNFAWVLANIVGLLLVYELIFLLYYNGISFDFIMFALAYIGYSFETFVIMVVGVPGLLLGLMQWYVLVTQLKRPLYLWPFVTAFGYVFGALSYLYILDLSGIDVPGKSTESFSYIPPFIMANSLYYPENYSTDFITHVTINIGYVLQIVIVTTLQSFVLYRGLSRVGTANRLNISN